MNRKVLSLRKLSEGLSKDRAKEMTGRTRGVKVRGFLERLLRVRGASPCSLGLLGGRSH